MAATQIIWLSSLTKHYSGVVNRIQFWRATLFCTVFPGLFPLNKPVPAAVHVTLAPINRNEGRIKSNAWSQRHLCTFLTPQSSAVKAKHLWKFQSANQPPELFGLCAYKAGTGQGQVGQGK